MRLGGGHRGRGGIGRKAVDPVGSFSEGGGVGHASNVGICEHIVVAVSKKGGTSVAIANGGELQEGWGGGGDLA